MSYQFTCYFNDVGIQTTEIYWGQQGISYSGDYGDAYLTRSGFYGNMRFTAIPASGYKFSHWVYRVGSITSAQKYDFNRIFTYKGEQDIWIRAVSTRDDGGGDGEDPSSWPYVMVGILPTRADNGSSMILCTFNSRSYPRDFALYRVDLYLTRTPYWNVAFNDSWTIDDDNPFSDTMDYDYHIDLTGVLSDGEIYRGYTTASGYYAFLFIVYYDEDVNRYYGVWQETGNRTTSNLITASAPTLSYDSTSGNITIGTVCSGRRIIEFHRTDVPYGGASGINDQDTLNEMLLTSLINMEGENRNNPYIGYYYLSNSSAIKRWRPGNYTIGVTWNSHENEYIMNRAIDRAIQQVNAIMSEFGVSFRRSGTRGNITITVDTALNIRPAGTPDNYYYGGQWKTITNGHIITGASIKLACDVQKYACFSSYDTIALEELLQSMGAGYDQHEYYGNTIHVDFNYYNKPNYVTENDANILRLVYSSEIDAGDDYTTVSRKLNIPKGCYMPSTSTENRQIVVPYSQFLESGATYEIRAFVVNESGNVSATSNWMTIETPELPESGCYIYHDGMWRPATPHIYMGGWKKAKPHVYKSGWH